MNKIWPQNSRACLVLNHFGSYFVRIFVHIFALYVGAGITRAFLRKKTKIIMMFERFTGFAPILRFVLVLQNAIHNKGIQFGNPETTRANRAMLEAEFPIGFGGF